MEVVDMKRHLKKAIDWYAEARARARRRRSPWNLLLIPLGFAAWAAIWYGLFCLIWSFHVALYPDHDFRSFWRKGPSFSAFIPSFLMVFALLPGSIGAGLMTANFLVWLLPPAQRALDAEAQGHPGTDFANAMKVIGRFATWSLGIGLIVSLLAAACLSPLE